MMKRYGKLLVGFVVILVYSLIIFNIAQAVDVTPTASPGSESDPIVSKSYVDQETLKLSTKIDTLTAENTKLTADLTSATAGLATLTAQNADLDAKVTSFGQLSGSEGALFQIVELKAGQNIFLGESTEFILRSGSAKAISGKNGGLSNLTTGGKDLTTGQAVPLNNHLLSSRDDGRGIKAVSANIFTLVKGAYTIK